MARTKWPDCPGGGRGRDAPIDALSRITAALDYPMLVVTTASGGERSGCLVGFHTQCSIDPPRFLVCISKANHTFALARRAGTLVMHFLTDDDLELAKLFGEETGDEVDKFALYDWRPGPDGVPVLAGVSGWLAARVLDRLDAGDHLALLVEPFAGEAGEPGERPRQLGFQDVREMEPGHPA